MSETTEAGNAAVLSGCPAIGICGGCSDLLPKGELLPAALEAAGFADAAVAPMHVSAPATRRRMDLAVRRSADGVELGLHRRRSHEIVDLPQCRVLVPGLVALLDSLRDALNRSDLLRAGGAVVGNWLQNGADLLLQSDAPASARDRTRLAAWAEAQGVARLSHIVGNGVAETLAMLRRPMLELSGVVVHPAPGAFLQATAEGEAAIVAAVLAGLPTRDRLRIAECHAGIGTLTFALAARGRVLAAEGDRAAFATLDEACRIGGLHGRITPLHRDLVRQPLMDKELAVDCVVLDPPAGGARGQTEMVAQMLVPRVIYVSCDPASLARDAGTLRRAGYTLLAATPIDQFIGTPRIESVCVFQSSRRKPHVPHWR